MLHVTEKVLTAVLPEGFAVAIEREEEVAMCIGTTEVIVMKVLVVVVVLEWGAVSENNKYLGSFYVWIPSIFAIFCP